MSMENLRLPTWKCWDFQAAGKESEWTGGTDPSPDGKASLQGLASLLKNVWYTNKIKVCPILEAKPMLLKRDRTALQSVVPSLFNQHAEDRQQWGQFPALPRHQVLSWCQKWEFYWMNLIVSICTGHRFCLGFGLTLIHLGILLR